MIWEYISIHGPHFIHRIDRCLNQQGYQQILEEQFYGSIYKLQLNASQVIFQQGNAPIYTSRKKNEWY